MATTVNVSTSYAGEFAGKYIAAALLSAPTLEQGGITIVPNVKYKQVIKKVATNDILKNATCDFDATSTITLTERILQPEEFQVNLQLCRSTFRSDWDAVQMGYSAFDTLPKSFADFLIAHAAAKVAAKIETNIWNGATANAGEFDGFRALMLADATVIDVAGAAAITAATIIDALGDTVDAIPAALYGNEGLRLYLSQKAVKAYVRALGGFSVAATSNSGVNAQGTQWYTNGSLSFDGIPIFMANGLNDDTMIATTIDNLYFATGLLSDQNEVRVIDMGDIDGSQNVRVVMRLTAGVNYGIGSDCVLYTS
jgi:hypothetical protein